jgi:hypothetical protein
MKKNKKFINLIVPGFYLWMLQVAFGGFISGIVSFFTKYKLEKWKQQKNKSIEENKD